MTPRADAVSFVDDETSQLLSSMQTFENALKLSAVDNLRSTTSSVVNQQGRGERLTSSGVT